MCGRRIGAEAIAHGVDAAAHVALAEELAQAAVGRARLRGERDQRGVDALDGLLVLPARAAAISTRARRDRPRARVVLVRQPLAAFAEARDARAHVRVDVLEDRAGFLPAAEKTADHGGCGSWR